MPLFSSKSTLPAPEQALPGRQERMPVQIYTYGDEQARAADASREAYQQALTAQGHGPITTEIRAAPELYYAEDYHQQYLAKNPGGYCGIGGTGVACPVGLAVS